MNKEALAEKVGKRIISLREKKGWSQSNLARACRKTPQWMERIESGNTNPTLFTLHIIASALDVPLFEVVKIK
jgi:putative transcriptional regulator